MRFLCLHGIGSNSRILQQQTAAIRYELGNRHTYEFVEGTLPWEPDPTLKENMLGDEQAFSYCDPKDAKSCLQVIELLEKYVATEGPYDGVIGFSLGANIALSWMMHRQRQRRQDAKRGHEDLPFKVGVFFSNTFPLYDMDALQQGRVDYSRDVSDEYLHLPTAHIWGARDAAPGQEHAEMASRTCKAAKRSVYVHSKAHEISASPDDLISMVKVINRAISEASC